MKDLTVFISYSWDSEEHKKWVRRLADYLTNPGGIEVILDQYDLKVGKVMTFFMESSIEKADKVLLILTPGYKAKASSGKSGASFEHSIISSELYDVQNDNTKFIPVLRSGNKTTSAPGYIKTLIYHDMAKDDKFESDAFNLVRKLYDEPEFSKPIKSKKPDLTQEIDPILERAVHLASDINIENTREAYAKSFDSLAKAGQELDQLFKIIKEKAAEYKSKTSLFFNAEYRDSRCILNLQGIGLKLFYAYSQYGNLKDQALHIQIWDKALVLDTSMGYFPIPEPQLIWSTIFIPEVTNDLRILWVSKNTRLSSKELNEYCFSTLFDFVRKKKIKQ